MHTIAYKNRAYIRDTTNRGMQLLNHNILRYVCSCQNITQIPAAIFEVCIWKLEYIFHAGPMKQCNQILNSKSNAWNQMNKPFKQKNIPK